MEQKIDEKLVGKIHKLLALARDGGATEGEANSAMEMAQKIMLANNLSMAIIEQSGGAVEGKRVKDTTSGEGNRSWAQYRWQRELMAEIGTVNFCHVSLRYGRTIGKGWKGGHRVIGYTVIGRESNVVAAKEMFVYLITTINRLLLEHNAGDHTQAMSKYSNSWKEGCADRLRERLLKRHEAALAEQKQEANEAKARAQHPAAASTGTSLVVVMEDYAEAEADLNRDMRMGWEPGRSARERAEGNAREAAREADRQASLDAAEASGASERELSTMHLYYCTLEEARAKIAMIDGYVDTRTDAQRQKAQEKEQREWKRWARAEETRRRRERNRLDYRGYSAGQRAADAIGLDKQIDRSEQGKLK